LRISDRAEFPLRSFHFRDKENPAIARALQGRRNSLRRQRLELVIAPLPRPPDGALDFETPGRQIQKWHRKMGTDIELFVRGNEPVEETKRHLKVGRLLFANDHLVVMP